jgi:hypothetical protein
MPDDHLLKNNNLKSLNYYYIFKNFFKSRVTHKTLILSITAFSLLNISANAIEHELIENKDSLPKNVNLQLIDATANYNIKSITSNPYIKLKKAYKINISPDVKSSEFSGAAFDDKGNLIVVDNWGYYLVTTPKFDKNNHLAGFENSIYGTLPGVLQVEDAHRNKDVEEIIVTKEGNCILSHEVSPDYHGMMSEYKKCDFTSKGNMLNIPKEIESLPRNNGIEAFTYNNNRFFAVQEYSSNEMHKVWQWTYDQPSQVKTSKYLAKKGYGISGFAAMPDGNILTLERINHLRTTDHKHRGEGFVAEINFLPLNLKDKQTIISHNLINFDNKPIDNIPALTDNFEAIFVREFSDKYSIFIMSDNNTSPHQNTFILQFDISKSDYNQMVKDLGKL